ncbi:heterokaryon incompatibility protein-domain-containing protein [Rhypophila decipiens]|uniref:Heterokaryon incompatibility protein-domain-containing protein n=1 Tax=Rhypophila decipiens TaxID=261697 RepID=A0AAN6YID6_9PEZI|nr:heterokaryon incompatibility protein-domain-containing protein [Rhypophila decipiens]
MDANMVETSLRRGVWFWCIFSAILPSGGIMTIVGLACIPAGIRLYPKLVPKTTVKSVIVPEKRKKSSPLSYILSSACGLGLYGTTRFLFRRWNSLAVCFGMYLLGLTYYGILGVIDKLKTSAETVYQLNQLRDLPGKIIMRRLVSKPPSRNPVIRYPLLLVGYAGLLIYHSFWLIISVFMDDTRQFVIDFRSKLRVGRLRLRRWAQRSRVVQFLFGKPKQYTYQPLRGRDTVRLLKLLPRRPLGSIHCELVELPVTDLPEYEALSYTWGNAGSVGQIWVAGKALQVTPTVEAALYHLSSYTKSRFLWIDQVCINQSDNSEKERQIPLMRQIYQNSSNVIIWLDGIEDPFKVQGMLLFASHEFVYGTLESWIKLVTMYSQQYSEAGWSQLMNLFAHPWFFRIWIIQEVVLAPSITVLVAGEPLNWDRLDVFVDMLYNVPALHELMRGGSNHGVEEDAFAGLTHVALISGLRKQLKEGRQLTSEAFTLEFLLGTFLASRSTLEVDRFYGLLGLLPQDFVAENWTWLNPDYSRPTEEVYTDVTKNLILHSKDANNIISYAGAGYRRNLPSLPSWVPDWSCLAMNQTLRLHFTKTQESSHYNASGQGALHQLFGIKSASSPPEFTFATDTDAYPNQETPKSTLLLLTAGHVFDSVLYLSPVHSYTEHNRGDGPDDISQKVDVIKPHLIARRLANRYALNPYPTNQAIDEVFWRTLVGDTGSKSRPADPSLAQGCRYWERILVEQVKAALGTGTIAEYDGIWEDETNPAPSVEELHTSGQLSAALVASNLWNSNRAMCGTGRRFCITRKGYMAMVPPGVEEGDMICILKGVNTPMVLRESKGYGKKPAVGVRRRVQLVGEMYVHGMMDGEAMLIPGREDEVFEIE